MARPSHLDLHLGGALHDGVKVFHLKPEQHAVAIRFVRAIADWAVVVLGFKAVQLQNELAILHQLLIVAAAMSATKTQQALIPAAAGFDIRDADERLGTHGSKTTRRRPGEQILKYFKKTDEELTHPRSRSTLYLLAPSLSG